VRSASSAPDNRKEANMNATITIPDAMMEDLRTGLHSVLGAAAESLADVAKKADRECHPEWYEEPLEELEHAITVLDVIGWSSNEQPARVALDAHEHRRVLLEAIDMVLLVAGDNLEELTRRAQVERVKRDRLAQRVEGLSDFAETVKAHTAGHGDDGGEQHGEEQRPTRRLQQRSRKASLR
jgi:hypothetical protein